MSLPAYHPQLGITPGLLLLFNFNTERKLKKICHYIIHYSLFTYSLAYGQEIPPTTEQQLENLTDADQAETEDDSYLQQLEQFRRNPINLNTADAAELKELRILTDLQIAKSYFLPQTYLASLLIFMNCRLFLHGM